MKNRQENIHQIACEEIEKLQHEPPFIKHEMDELVYKLANSGDQDLIDLGNRLN